MALVQNRSKAFGRKLAVSLKGYGIDQEHQFKVW